jgi:hypothetical protein
MPPLGIPDFDPNHLVYIKGYPDGTVRADANITRAETAEIIFRLLKKEVKAQQFTSQFPDVISGAWYYESVSFLAGRSILKGYLDGTFRPDNPITRAEFATMISGFDNLVPADYNNFTDIEGHWAVGYINSAAEIGWVAGYPDGSFKPENNITRAEVASVINRMLNRKIEIEDIPDWAVRYSDLKETHWAYADFVEASTEHDFIRKNKDEIPEIWAKPQNR